MTGKIGRKGKGFWAELKRRGVVATTIAYVIGASILVEGSDLVEDILELPEWVPRTVFVLAILALPLVVLLSWFFNIERDPADELADIAVLAKPDERRQESEEQSRPPSPQDATTSVAILPFETLSTEEAHRFLAVGISNELHSIFSRMHRVRVASNSLTHRYAGENPSTNQLAAKLNVDRIISGSVQCEGNEMIVIVEFENAQTGEQIGADMFRRKLTDVLTVQHEIVEKAALRFAEYRQADEIKSAAVRSTTNLDAWSLVQRARTFVLGFTPKALSDAVPLLRQAIELDPEYRAAHAVLAMVLAEQVLNGLSDSPVEDRRLALDAAHDAYSISHRDYFIAKMCGPVWAYFGRTERSLSALRRAVNLAPYDFGSWGYLGWPLVESGSQQDIAELHEIIEHINDEMPDHPGVPYWMYHQSAAYLSEGEDEKAAEFAEKSVAINRDFPWVWMHLVNVYGRLGRERSAKRALESCLEISPSLTPDYYEERINEMSKREDFIECRTDGLKSLGLI